METVLFALYALTACGGALGVVLSQNVVRMAFWLVVSLGATAGLFFLLHADFVAATQLLIYVGGTVVLLIFGVMLTSSSPFAAMKTTPAELLQGGFLGLALLGVMLTTVLAVHWNENNEMLRQVDSQVNDLTYNPPETGNTSRPIGTALLGARFDRDLRPESEGLSPSLSPGYLLVFEIISVHLLVVLVGAAYLARAKQVVRNRTDSRSPEQTAA